jgi:hypothetical protein
MKIRKEIQTQFKVEMGLTVDKLECCGSGTADDGNTARQFVSNLELAASVTGLYHKIIKCQISCK